MAIVKMNKFTLLAFDLQRNMLLENLQTLENVELVDFSNEDIKTYGKLKRHSASIEISEIEGEVSKVKFVIELLEKFNDKPNALKALKEGKKLFTYDVLENIFKKSNWKSVYSELKKDDNEITRNNNNISKIKGNVDELKPWIKLDASISNINSLNMVRSFLGSIPNALIDRFKEEISGGIKDYYLEIISTNGKDTNLLLLVQEEDVVSGEQILKGNGFTKANITCDDVPVKVIDRYEEEISALEKANEEIVKGIKNLINNLEEFKLIYEYFTNKLLRLKSSENFLNSDNIMVIEGYYPSEIHDKFAKIVNSTLKENYYLESEEAQGDDIPVKLRNNTVFEAFEPITAMYSVPKYREIDPTPLFAPFYILFFGMMLSDAGYGIVMFIGTLIALKSFNLDEGMRKTVKMFFFLSMSTVLWGALYGSYFGEELIPAIWMKPDANVSLLMIVSVAMGLVQIYVGLGIKAYMLVRDGDPMGAVWDSGLWYITLTGSILWVLSAFGVTVPNMVITIAKIMTLSGMVLIVATHGRNEKSIGAKLGAGFYSLYGITSYVGDLVSYTRLAALGLATGFISYAFNVMTDMVSSSLITFIFGALIFIVGHTFNLFINALGSYVHTSRLQYLEYFGKFYEGGGKAFAPLKYNSQYFKIVKVKNEEE